MTYNLPLIEFHAPDSERLAIREHAGLGVKPLKHILFPGERDALVLARTVTRGARLAGKLRQVGLIVLVLTLGGSARAGSLNHFQRWTEGLIVDADPSRHTFTLTQNGRRGTAVFFW